MSQSKIDRLRRELEQAEADIVNAETYDPSGYHANLDQIDRRDQIARKLAVAIDRANTPRLIDPLSVIGVIVAMCAAMWVIGCIATWGK